MFLALSCSQSFVDSIIQISSLCQTFGNSITRDKDARPSEDDPVAEIVSDVLLDLIILRSRLQPQGRNPKGFCLLKNAKGHLQKEEVSAIFFAVFSTRK